jgi:hypothetical protein
MAKNICDCPKPPGGKAVCPAEQLAICRVVNGEPYTECVSPPGGRLFNQPSALELQLWALSAVTRETRTWLTPPSDAEVQMLLTGEYHNKSTGEVVMFSLPEHVKAIIQSTRDTDLGLPS